MCGKQVAEFGRGAFLGSERFEDEDQSLSRDIRNHNSIAIAEELHRAPFPFFRLPAAGEGSRGCGSTESTTLPAGGVRQLPKTGSHATKTRRHQAAHMWGAPVLGRMPGKNVTQKETKP